MLTGKEIKVLELTQKGLKQTDIAKKLKISQPAVSNFYKNAMHKIIQAEKNNPNKERDEHKMRELRHLIILITSLLIFTALFVSMVRADIIGSTGGGSLNVTITPDPYSAGSFTDSGITPPGEVTPPPIELPPSGGGGGVVRVGNITVSPSQFNIVLLINTNIRKSLTITNTGTSSRTLSITQSGLDSMIIIENASLTLGAGQTNVANVVFVAPAVEGVYNGTIYAGTIPIPVTITVLKEFILFDSNIVVLNKNYQVPQGEPLETEVTMIPMGGAVRMDVTLNYVIKDLNGTVFLTRSETLLVEGQKSIRRNFDTGALPLGKYIVELELIYTFGIAPSSAHFDVIESIKDLFSSIIYWIMFMIIIILIILIVITIMRIIRKSQRNIVVNSEPEASAY